MIQRGGEKHCISPGFMTCSLWCVCVIREIQLLGDLVSLPFYRVQNKAAQNYKKGIIKPKATFTVK